MCGVTGYIGKQKSKQFILDALSKLQYRGHSSASFACLTDDKKISVVKEHGSVESLKKSMCCYQKDGLLAIGNVHSAHRKSPALAHPLTNESGNTAFVYSGYISNEQEIKRELIKRGYHVDPSIGMEVIPHLFDRYVAAHDNLKNALKKMVQAMQGSFALIGLTETNPDVLISIRKRSPLSILVDDDGVRVASDFRAIHNANHSRGFFQPDETFGIISADEIELYSFDGKQMPVVIRDIPLHPPVYEVGVLDNLFDTLQDHLRIFLKPLFPDRTMPQAHDEFLALAKTMLSGSHLNQQEEKHVAKIMQAFDHLQEGTYGLCFACGNPISEQVLAMHPHMSFCKGCHGLSEIRA